MRRVRIPSFVIAFGFLIGLSCGFTLTAATEAESARQFEAHVAPLLARHCFECHDSTSQEGRLDLSHKESALAERKSGKMIVPGKASESLLWKVIESNEMPEDRPPLSPEDKKRLRDWIDSGAVWAADEIDPLAYTRDRRAAYNWMRRLTVPEYIETVRSALGVEIEAEARRLLPPDVRADGFQNTAYNLSADLQHVEAYSRLAEMIVRKLDVPAFVKRFTECNSTSEACLREVITSTGKWLLRGPLEEHEITPYLDLAKAVKEDGGKFNEVARYIIEAMLQSPRFLYQIEGQLGDGKSQPVQPYELASRLSYTLWGAPPDKELIRAAEAGELAKSKPLKKQVQRMLNDPRAVKRSSRFLYEWLDLGRLSNLRPDPKHFPTWHGELAADMRAETLAYFEEIAWKQKRPLSELLNAKFTFATPRLAEFYGIQQPPTEAGKPARITDDLLALYTFEEGGGELIRDLSDAGEPIHLKIEKTGAVRWNRTGLEINAPTQIMSEEASKRLVRAVKKSNALTLEAWVTPSDATQSGPARIMTLSSGASQRNFTLGQDGAKFDVRLRARSTDANGQPSLSAPEHKIEKRLTHVVYTRDSSGKAKLYVNGKEKASRDVPGNFSNWDDKFRLLLANESTEDRPWRGTFHLAAIYSRALSADEVKQNRQAGARKEQQPTLAGATPGRDQPRGLQALYRFSEGKGEVIADASAGGESLDLKIENPANVQWSNSSLTIKDSTLISHPNPPKHLIAALKKSNAVTIEAWITPAALDQKGPARIFTLSSGPSERNFTLGQESDKFEVRFRSSKTDANGMPALTSPNGAVKRSLTHVVYTRDAKGQAHLYIDGEDVAAQTSSGDLSNWSDKYRLAIGNETSKDRPWRGTFHLLAIYDRALTAPEIRSTVQPLTRYDLASIPSRGGLLTQGSLLTIGGEEASMVTRGLFVLQDFLYSRVGNPPPCADTTPIPSKPGLTQRAIAEVRIQSKSCGGCHSKFEPLAFGLEKFDGLGAYHEKDEFGNKLREDGEITFPGADQPSTYRTSAELMDLLADSDRVRKNITRKVTQFAIGRPLVESDAATLDKIHETTQKGGGTYASLITAIVMSDLVRMVQTERE